MKNIDNPGFCVDMLCGMQNMSRTGFFNKLKALTGHAPADYIAPCGCNMRHNCSGKKTVR